MKTIDTFVAWMVKLIAVVMPLAAPVPAMWMAYEGLRGPSFGWPGWVAALIALVIEGFGFAGLKVTLDLWRMTRLARRKADRRPWGLAALAIGFYFVLVVTLNVALHWGEDGRVLLVRGLLTLMPIAGGTLLVLQGMNISPQANLTSTAPPQEGKTRGRKGRNGPKTGQSPLRANGSGAIRLAESDLGQMAQVVPGQRGQVVQVKSGRRWPELSPEERRWIATAMPREIRARYGVSKSTAKNWRRWAQQSME